jgi:alkylated DNA repair dioxygenase AlkB
MNHNREGIAIGQFAPHIGGVQRLSRRMSVMATQVSLFDEPALAGLSQADAIVSADEERRLTASIDAVELSPFRFHGWEGKRQTASYGWRYDFDNARFGPADTIPDWLLPLRAKAARFAGLKPGELVQALLIRYDPGAGIGWHRDRPLFAHVIGISLGARTTMRFRRRRGGGFDRASALLAPRSVYHLMGEARHDWEHSIAAMEITRWSITFRSLSEQGQRTVAGIPR